MDVVSARADSLFEAASAACGGAMGCEDRSEHDEVQSHLPARDVDGEKPPKTDMRETRDMYAKAGRKTDMTALPSTPTASPTHTSSRRPVSQTANRTPSLLKDNTASASPTKKLSPLKTSSPTKRIGQSASRPSSQLSLRPASRPTSPTKRKEYTLEVGPHGIHFAMELPESKIVLKGAASAQVSPAKYSLEEVGTVGKDGRVTPVGMRAKGAVVKGLGSVEAVRSPSPLKVGTRKGTVKPGEGARESGTKKASTRAKSPLKSSRVEAKNAAVSTRSTPSSIQKASSTAIPAATSTATPKRPFSTPKLTLKTTGLGAAFDQAPLLTCIAPLDTYSPRDELPPGLFSHAPDILTRKHPQNMGEMMAGLSGHAAGMEGYGDASKADVQKYDGAIAAHDETEESNNARARQLSNPEVSASTPQAERVQKPIPIAHRYSPAKHSDTSETSGGKTAGTPRVVRDAIALGMDDVRLSLSRSMGPKYLESPTKSKRGDPGRWLGSADMIHKKAACDGKPSCTVVVDEQGMAAMRTKRPSASNKTRASAAAQTPPHADRTVPLNAQSPCFGPLATRPRKVKRTWPTTTRQPITPRLVAPNYPSTGPQNSDPSKPSPMSKAELQEQTFTSASQIAQQVEAWNSEESKKQAGSQTRKSPPSSPPTRAAVKVSPPRESAIRAIHKDQSKQGEEEERQSYTPAGSPTKPLPITTLKNPKVHTATGVASKPSIPKMAPPKTPVPATSAAARRRLREQGAPRTPSKETQCTLDKAIDAALEEDARNGRVFTPSGQRISELLAKRRVGENI